MMTRPARERQGPPRKYPLLDLPVGQSFIVDGVDNEYRVRVAASRHGKRFGKSFTVSKQRGAIVCTRTR